MPSLAELALEQTGWIPFENRTPEEQHATEEWHEQIGFFEDVGTFLPNSELPERVLYYELEIDVCGELLPRPYQYTGSCLPANSPVRMADGTEKPISDIIPGDLVISHTGLVRRVNGVQAKKTTEHMRRIRLTGWADDLLCTDKHVVAIWSGDEIEWKPAEEIRPGDYLIAGYGTSKPANQTIDVLDWVEGAIDVDRCADWNFSTKKTAAGNWMERPNRFLNRPRAFYKEVKKRGLIGKGLVTLGGCKYESAIPRYINVDEDFARWVGLYLAEGSCDGHRVAFVLSSDETELANEIAILTRRIFGLDSRIGTKKTNKNTLWVRITSKVLRDFIKSFCPGVASTKRVPGIFFGCRESVQASLVSGWFDGDGHARIKNGHKFAVLCGVTGSNSMSRDMAHLASSSGVPASTRRRKPLNQSKEAFEVSMMPHKAVKTIPSTKIASVATASMHARTSKQTRFGTLKKVAENIREDIPVDAVWDIEVDVDHSFLAYGIVVHNCVGVSGARAQSHAMLGDRLHRGDQERVFLPFPFATYGVGRSKFARGTGSGSYGKVQAEAARDFGMVDVNFEKVPQPNIRDGWAYYSKSIELSWSHPKAWPVPMPEMEAHANEHQTRSIARIRTLEGRIQALAQGYGVTDAGNFGSRPRVQQGYLVADWNGSWAHQMSNSGYDMKTPHGLMFAEDNQWGPNPYGANCPTLGRIKDKNGNTVRGSHWCRESVMKRRTEVGECYAISNTEGFPLRKIDWGKYMGLNLD